MQYIFEKEGVFWEEDCYNPDSFPSCEATADGIICPDDIEKEPCASSREEFNQIYTLFLLTTSFSVLVLEPIQINFGMFIIRFILGALTTGGAIMLIFYDANPYLIYGTWQLMGFASTMYIIVNIAELCATFPTITAFTIGMVNGTYDAS